MSIPRSYYSGQLKEGSEIELPASTSHHVATVRRLKKSDEFIVFNGSGFEFSAEIIQVTKKSVRIRIIKKIVNDRESPLSITIAQSISRGARMDYVIQKAVELGVHAITPLYTERCGVKLSGDRLKNRVSHWESVIISAAEQSGRLRIPALNSPLKINDWIGKSHVGDKLICDPEISSDYKPSIAPKKIIVLVGPEGGFTEDELQKAKTNGFKSLNLGPRVLRTETAGIVAIAVLQSRYGDLY
jgi:16S rRNA (uracil1498-N3)-methyltransferase